MSLQELPPVEVKENDVCVRMIAGPINPFDINRIEGVYPVRPQVPAIEGYEGVGEVYIKQLRYLYLNRWEMDRRLLKSPLSQRDLT
ncbi:enoyl-[acyl-carrier-protein] reductase, mitochondrial-like [Cannabis sativa]|uniref:enoyl-[acyl-carrier-protein] reductase, mitochondrial-like n=1 Tax=Cannabis sativa TaxID=3483 RepID=UPI0029CA67AB|nr:enoyl-[acyl-carrier-protein] reductase, mitochondrial-like [Cannabis sativa]